MKASGSAMKASVSARRRVRHAVLPLSAAATDTLPVAAARRGRPAPLPRGTARHARRGADRAAYRRGSAGRGGIADHGRRR
jgi:hypothetical protein